MATLVEFGVGDALTLWIAREVENIRGNLIGAFFIGCGVSAAGILVGALALPYTLRVDQHRLLSDAYACLTLIPAYLLSLIPAGALLGLRRFHAVAAVRVLSTFGYLISVIAVVATHHGNVTSFMWLNVLARSLPLFIGLAFLFPVLAASKVMRLNVVATLKDGAKLHASKLATVLSASEDRAIANLTLSQAAIGQWQVASTLTFIIPFIAQGLSQHLYGSIPTSRAEDRARMTGTAYTRAMIFTALLCILLVPVLPVAIPLVYGRDFAGAVVPSIIVVFAGIFSAGISVLQAAARAVLQTRICIESELVGIAGTALIAWLSIPAMDLVGLAISLLGGRILALVWLGSRGRALNVWVGKDLIPSSASFRERVLLEWRKLTLTHD